MFPLAVLHHLRAQPHNYVEVRQSQRAVVNLHNDPVSFRAHL